MTSTLLVASLLLSAAPAGGANKSPDAAALRRLSAQFVPVALTADVSKLPANEQKALARMVQAAQLMDTLYMRQVWAGNESLLFQLIRDGSPLGRERLHFFLINKGPWDRLDQDVPFIPGVRPKPAQGDFYPAGSTKDEISRWLDGLQAEQRARATGFFTTVRRTPEGSLLTVPYSVEYQGELGRAAALLREAADLTTQPTLKAFLGKRADAFLSNDYYASDVSWMELDSSVEPTIGPYEVYEDEWFNLKASFEAFVTIRDAEESAKLARFSAQLQDVENHLPMDDAFKNAKIGLLAPIRVVNSIFSSGDGNRGVQTAAYNLPNDERIIAEKGTKRVMLKNVQEAKYEKTLVPISRIVLGAADQRGVSFEAFFTHTLMHELMHGLGPHNLTLRGKATTVRRELQESYSPLEEAKADISGLFALQYLIDKGVIDRALERTIYTTFLASAFRSIRFGLNEAHGKGVAMQLNYLLDAGGYRVGPDGRFTVVPAKIKEGVKALTHEILTIQAQGDVAKARALLTRLSVNRPETKALIEQMKAVPVDIEPRFPTAERLLAQYP